MKKILDILSEIRPELDFTTSKDFVEDGYLDSFDVVMLVSTLEEEFHILIDALDVVPENFCSLDAIVSVVRKNGGIIE